MNDNYNDLDLFEESFRGKLGQKVRSKIDDDEASKIWNNKSGRLKHGVYHNTDVSDYDFKTITEYFSKIKSAKTYSEYKVWFDKICHDCMFSPVGCIIQTYRFKRGKEKDHNEICITYTNTRHKITIPNGYELYHRSTKDDIKELLPFFKGKQERGYLYSSPRIYLSIRKKMGKRFADLKPGTKSTMYRVVEDIRTAYVDPLVAKYKWGAIYIETTFPVKVEKIDDSVKESVNNGPNFDNIKDFCEYYNFQLVEDDDIVNESVKSKIGGLFRKKNDEKELDKMINTTKISINEITKSINQSDYEKIRKYYSDIKSSDNFKNYKKSYTSLCQLCNIEPKDSIIEEIKFNETSTKDKIVMDLKYHKSKSKIIIPREMILTYRSDNEAIRELEPEYFCKRRNMLMYPTKRVYFTLTKKPDHTLSKKGRYVYTPEEIFRTAYIDSNVSSLNLGCIYIETNLPIPVKQI